MKEISFLVGGKAGDGVKQAGNLVARLLNDLGYWIFVYEDYPSLITGGHNFSIIRAAEERILAHRDEVDLVIAFNEETIQKHKDRFKENTVLIYDSDVIEKKKGIGIPMSTIAKDNNLPLIVRNTIALGVLAGAYNLDFQLVEKIIREAIPVKIEENLKVAKIGYDEAVKNKSKLKIEKLGNKPKKLLTGNEAIALGGVRAGLNFYIAYPMTPASSILHFLAQHQDEFGIKVIQPEDEIAVILMAEGAAYAGARTMVGTSGGGFALMTEALSLAGQAEIPVVFVLSQRVGPATGVPTYTAQGDLLFALFAGHGEFPRIVVAPGDVDEAFYLTAEAMNLAWQYQTPAIVLSDKHLSESTFSGSFDEEKVKVLEPKIWDGEGEYRRYQDLKDGISPLAFPGNKKAIVKLNSYEHDEYGITTEESEKIVKMINKRLRKGESLGKEIEKKEAIKVYGERKSKIALITWGATKGSVVEVGEKLGLKIIQPLFLEPFPEKQIKKELEGIEKVIDIEVNATGQLATLLRRYDILVDEKILKYDGRPFTVNELEEKIKKILK